MTIEIKVTGNSIEEVRAAFDNIARRDAPTITDVISVIKDLSLDQLREFITKRFADEGFIVSITAPEGVPVEKEEPTTSLKKPKPKGPPPKITQESAIDALKGEDSTPEGDRQFVIDTLTGLWGDPSKVQAVKDFVTRHAGKGKKISDVGPAEFPKIRVDMMKEFNLAN